MHFVRAEMLQVRATLFGLSYCLLMDVGVVEDAQKPETLQHAIEFFQRE